MNRWWRVHNMLAHMRAQCMPLDSSVDTASMWRNRLASITLGTILVMAESGFAYCS